MEINPFGPKNPESSGDDADDDSSSKKKKTAKRAPIFGSADDKSTKQEKSDDGQKPETAEEPLWRRILGQEENKSATTSEESEENTDEDSTVVEASAEIDTTEESLATLSETEQLAVAEAYIAGRHAELLEEQAASVEGEDDAAVEERAANITLLEAMRAMLSREHPTSETLETPAQEAYVATAQTLGYAETAPSLSGQELSPQSPPTESEVRPLSHEQEISLRQNDDEPTPTTVASFGPTREFAAAPKPVTRTESIPKEQEVQRRVGSALMVGGVIGYLIGRRRGRIKTEKQFKSVEAKLTKHIENVQQIVAQKEQKIRGLARENYEAKAALQVRPLNERVTPKIEKRAAASTEHLGVVTMKAVESPRAQEARIERLPQNPNTEKSEPPKNVETLSRSELLVAASEIKVGATDLRRVFETNLISEYGLRRLVVESNRGGNVRESLEREIIEKEMSYERDPLVRNRNVGSLAAGKVVRADIDRPGASVTARQSSQQVEAAKAAQQQPKSNVRSQATQPVAVAATVTLVVVIAVLIFILFRSA